MQEAIDVIIEAMRSNPEAAELHYRMVAYLFSQGHYQEAMNYLETGLSISPEKHEVLFEYLPQLQQNSTIQQIIQRYLI